MTYNEWLCVRRKEAISLEECSKTPCNERNTCMVYRGVIESTEPEAWEKKLPLHHAWTSAIINLSLSTLNRSKTINLPEMQKKHSIGGIVTELDIPNCGYRGYFFMKNGRAVVLSNGIGPDCVLLTSWQVLRQLYNGWTTVFDFQQQREVNIPYNPELAFNWGHLQLVKLNTEKNVYSQAYLFADELYNTAFPIVREQAKLSRLI